MLFYHLLDLHYLYYFIFVQFWRKKLPMENLNLEKRKKEEEKRKDKKERKEKKKERKKEEKKK